MSIVIFLISPLSVEECIARFVKAKKRDDIPFSRDYLPPYGELVGNIFKLQVNTGRSMPYMYGEFAKAVEGTLITCSMEIAEPVRKFNTLWPIFALPFFLFLTVFGILDGFKNGFSTTHLVVVLIGISLPILKWYMQRVSNRQFELDKKELLDFLETTLDAKRKLF